MDACANCHEEIARQFERSTHGALAGFEYKTPLEKCESCHGGGSAHVESGSAADINGLKDSSSPETMQCSSCHDVHGTNLTTLKTEARTNDLCTRCHKRQAGPFVYVHYKERSETLFSTLAFAGCTTTTRTRSPGFTTRRAST